MGSGAATIHLVDDDERVLRALRRLLVAERHRVCEHRSAEEFLECHNPHEPGCAIIDIGLPGLDGFAIQEALGAHALERPIIFLTGGGDIASSVRAMKAGAVDFLTKPIEASTLLAAVAQAIDRDTRTRQDFDNRHSVERRLTSLTPREREVFALVVAGLLNKQIAAELGTVEKTVKVHRGRMMEKMQVRTVADLVRLATIARV